MDWPEAQRQIIDFLIETLAGIEWHYGDNRAPFIFPPEFSKENDNFICIIGLEDSAQSKLTVSAASEELLADKVRTEIGQQFLSME